MDLIRLSHKEFLKIDRDYEKAASAADLVYVNDKDPGIIREKKGKGFTYIYDNKPLHGKGELDRITKLAVPPAWTHVWICTLPNGHIQATGFDARSRKQYRYHHAWHTLRNETKFHRQLEFGKALPSLRLKVEDDLATKELSQEKVIAAVIGLMERTYIRVGNSDYEKQYGSYGMTTMKDRHVTVSGDQIEFTFKGKKGINHKISIRNRRLAKVVKSCRDVPGKELFQYLDQTGDRRSIDSGAVNNYIKSACGGDFSAKDFRTWAGSLNLLRAFRSLGQAGTETDCKKNIVAAIDEVSRKLGNSRSICKKYYVHPALIKLYEENNLDMYLSELNELEEPDQKTGLTKEEKVLMKILQAHV